MAGANTTILQVFQQNSVEPAEEIPRLCPDAGGSTNKIILLPAFFYMDTGTLIFKGKILKLCLVILMARNCHMGGSCKILKETIT